MTEDIIRMAREAGWDEIGTDLWGAKFDGAMSTKALKRFAELVRADEREECAKECEIEAAVTVVNAPKEYQDGRAMGAAVCASRIRARGNK